MKFFPRTNDLFDTVLDDMFTSPIFSTRNDMAMKTDITEKDGKYLLDMELPGCKKEDIHLELNDGYLSVSASRNTNKEEKDDKGNPDPPGALQRQLLTELLCRRKCERGRHQGQL